MSVQVLDGGLDGSTAYATEVFVLTNRANRPCRIGGYPRLDFVSVPAGTVTPAAETTGRYDSGVIPRSFPAAAPDRRYVLSPGQRAVFYVQTNITCPYSRPAKARVSWPGTASSLTYPPGPNTAILGECPDRTLPVTAISRPSHPLVNHP